MEHQFEIDVWSRQDYDRLVAEVTIDGQYIGLLSQETVDGPILFELEPELTRLGWKIQVELLEELLRCGKQRLRKLDEPRSKSDTV